MGVCVCVLVCVCVSVPVPVSVPLCIVVSVYLHVDKWDSDRHANKLVAVSVAALALSSRGSTT